ncbi:MAG: hypothetical protein HYZ48_01585, partial [Chlamydiales bacterium]|nr:hypothetical protein [Chlamydiales bacterium]
MAHTALILEKLLLCKSLEDFTDFSKKERSILVEQLWKGAKAALLTLLLHATDRKILLISSGTEDNLFQDCQTLLKEQVLEFPSWETLPQEEITPSSDIIGKRLDTLTTLIHTKGAALLMAPLQACLQKLPSAETLKPLSLHWKTQAKIPFSSLSSLLSEMGYRKSSIVIDKGEYAIRGGILDLFPISSFNPYRIEFFEDTIEEIRSFDPISQKSIGKVKEFSLPPASEEDLLRKGKTLSTLFDFLGEDPLIIFNDLESIEERYISIKKMMQTQDPYLISWDAFLEKCRSFPTHFWTENPVEKLSHVQIKNKVGRTFYSGKNPLQELTFEMLDQKINAKRWEHPFHQVEDFFSLLEDQTATTGSEILQGIHRLANTHLDLYFLSSSEADELHLQELIRQEKISLSKNTHFDRGYLSSGFVLEETRFACIPTTELSHRYKPRRQKWRNTYHTPASEFHALSLGDIVVN